MKCGARFNKVRKNYFYVCLEHINYNLFCTMGNNPIRYVDPDGRKIFDARWWKRNADELAGMFLDGIEILTGIAATEITLGLSNFMTFQGSANATYKLAKIIITTCIADIDGDFAADNIDNQMPESAFGGLLYGIGYLVSKFDGTTGYKNSQFQKMCGRVGDCIDMIAGLALSTGLNKDISKIFDRSPEMLSNIQKILKYNKSFIITNLGENAYQWLSDVFLTKDMSNCMLDYYYGY